ncbi:hypothetical protein ACXYMW_12050, partial [Roseivivax sp. CAU 1761]
MSRGDTPGPGARAGAAAPAARLVAGFGFRASADAGALRAAYEAARGARHAATAAVPADKEGHPALAAF